MEPENNLNKSNEATAQTTDSPQKETPVSMLLSNKTLIIAIAIGLVVLVLGVVTLFGMGEAGKYQGLIKQVENEALR